MGDIPLSRTKNILVCRKVAAQGGWVNFAAPFAWSDSFVAIFQLTHLAIWGSIGCWFIWLAVYSHLWPIINLAPEMVGMVSRIDEKRKTTLNQSNEKGKWREVDRIWGISTILLLLKYCCMLGIAGLLVNSTLHKRDNRM